MEEIFSNKIWVTRKTRIYTEQRLKRKAFLSQLLMIVYSFLLVAISVWNLVHSSQPLNMLSVFGSIAVLISSVFLLSQRYTERALEMRNCYIRLDELYYKVKKSEISKDYNSVEQLQSEYTSILLNIDNHSDYDYLCLRFSLRNNDKTTLPPFTWKNYLSYILEKFWRYLLIIAYFILPLLLTIFWSLTNNNVSFL